MVLSATQIGKFRTPRWPSTSACFCAKARLMRVTSHQEDKQHEKTESELEKKATFETLKGFGGLNRYLQTAKGKSARHH